MAFELFDLTGKRAFITGSSQGIGFALAQGLAEHGAEVVLNGRDASKLDAAAAKLTAAGHKVSVAGSGTGSRSPLTVKAALNAPAPTMSVPIRSQSGSRFSLRIQLWRSVAPSGNGVPGGTTGRGAESQKKSPLASCTCGTKK